MDSESEIELCITDLNPRDAALEAAIERVVRDVTEVMARYDMEELRELLELIKSASRPPRQLLHNGKKPRK